jgi:class 3 adenylate cyclase
MSDHLLIVSTPNRQTLRIVLTEPIDFGRDCDGLSLADSLVSRRHVRIEPGADGVVLVTDLGSSNGTTVDGSVTVGPTPAKVGSIVALGATRIEVAVIRTQRGSPAANVTEFVGRSQPTDTTSMEKVVHLISGDLAPVLVGAGMTDEPDTLTIMFSDIEGSTQHAVAVGDTAWFALLGKHKDLVTAQVRAHRGRIVKNQGDGFMMCFRSARSALLCAIGIQKSLEEWAGKNPDEAIRVRIGMHTGEVMVDDGGDLFGRHVVTAARVGGAASGGEILVSGLVKQIAQPRGDITFGPPCELELKGLPEPQVVHSVDWAGFTRA